MANQVCLQRTEFKNLSDGKTSTGWRIYDDYGQTYNNLGEAPENDLELLEFVKQNGDDVSNTIMNFIHEDEKGIEINGTWYDWDEIKHLWQ